MAESAFGRMVLDFKTKLNELKAITLLRLEDSSVDMFAAEMASLEETVKGLEEGLHGIRAHIRQEKQALPQMEALLSAYRSQHEHLRFIADNLPTYLPGQTSQCATDSEARTAEAATAARTSAAAEDAAYGNENVSHNISAARPASAEGGGEKRKRPPAPRRYITQDELGSLSSYMTARLSLDKVNAAVDDAVTLAEGVARMLAAARTKGKLAAPERKRAQMLLVNVQKKEGVKGHHWFMDADMRAANVLKLDKTGKALLTVLRHLGRLQELRLNVEGSMQSVYVVQ